MNTFDRPLGAIARPHQVAVRVPGFRARSFAAPRNDDGVKGDKVFYVYLLASRKYGTLYLGVTNDLVRRIHQHREGLTPGFTSRYGVKRLVWFERFADAPSAIQREKELKKWRRDWKIRLLEETNPDWLDLYDGIAQSWQG
jgi:putative endonuclease